MSVNAIACAPKRLEVPERATGGWEIPLGTGTRAPSAEAAVPSQPTEWWRSGLGRAAAGPPAFGDEMIVAATVDRYLSLLLRETGDRAWKKRLNAPCVGGPILAGDRIFTATGGVQGRVYAFTLGGKRIWEQRLGPVAPPIALAGDLLVAATETGRVVALAAGSGKVRWTHTLPQRVRTGIIPMDDGLLVATDDSLFRLATGTGAVVRRVGLPGTVIGLPAWVGDTLVLTTAAGHIVALDRRSLTTLWTVEAGSSFFGGPALARDTAFAVSLRGDLWHVPLGRPAGARAVPLGAAVRAAPTPTRDGVLIGTVAGEIVLVRPDGTVETRGRVEGPIEQPPVALNGAMFVIDGRGRVHAWR